MSEPGPARSEPASARKGSGGRTFAVVLVAACAVGLLDGGIGIGSRSVDGDEGFSLSTSLRSWSSLGRLSIRAETNAWFYAVVLKAWSLFGTGLGFLRLPSLVAFGATVVLASVLARELFGARVASITAVLVAVNGALLVFADQVRGYSLAVALGLGATWAFVLEVRRPGRWRLVTWLALVVLTAQVSLQAVVILPVQLVSLLAVAPERRYWRRRLGAAVPGVLLVAVTAYAIFSHDEGQSASLLTWGAVQDSLDPFVGHGARYGLIAFGCGAGWALVALRAAWRGGHGAGDGDRPGDGDGRRFALTLLAAWMVLPPVLMTGATLVAYPTLRARYLILCAPAMCIALALLLERLVMVGPHRPGTGAERAGSRGGTGGAAVRAISFGAAVALCAGAAYGSVAWHTESTTNRWDEVTSYVFDHAEAGDRLVVATDINRLYFEYERGQRSPRPSDPRPGFPSAPWGGYATGDETYTSPTAAQFAAAQVGARRLWVVVYDDGLAPAAMRPLLASLSPAFSPVSSEHFPLHIQVYLYRRASAAG